MIQAHARLFFGLLNFSLLKFHVFLFLVVASANSGVRAQDSARSSDQSSGATAEGNSLRPAIPSSTALDKMLESERNLQQGELSPLRDQGGVFSISSSVATALKNYPSIAAHEARQKAISSKVTLAKTEYLPKFDLFAQELRGSDNNVLGILFPPLSIPQVSGRQSGPIGFDSVWASNVSAFFSWEVVDFGLRHEKVKAARAETSEAGAGVVVTKFQVASAAADAFFALLAAKQEVQAQKANADRMRVFATSVHALVDADLRPGVDASRADAELALAQDKLILSEQEREVRRAHFAETLGLAGSNVDVDEGPLLTIPADRVEPKLPPFEFHPVALHQAAIIKTVNARRQVLKKEYRPRIYMEGAIFSRGSGAELRNYVAKIGYLPSVPNWAVGVKAQFHTLSIFAIRAQERDVISQEVQERAKYDEVMQVLKGKDAEARALIDGASRLAANAPILLKAAQDTEMRARTRYGVGLCTVVDVAEAEKLLVQAQVKFNLAGLAVWKSYLSAAEAHGDLSPFLQLVSSAKPGIK